MLTVVTEGRRDNVRAGRRTQPEALPKREGWITVNGKLVKIHLLILCSYHNIKICNNIVIIKTNDLYFV